MKKMVSDRLVSTWGHMLRLLRHLLARSENNLVQIERFVFMVKQGLVANTILAALLGYMMCIPAISSCCLDFALAHHCQPNYCKQLLMKQLLHRCTTA